MAASAREQFFASEMQNEGEFGCDVGPSALGFGEPPGLHRSDFKLVVASWRRQDPTHTPTNNFLVDVSSYTPRQSLINRVTLVDVDIPNTQLLIEDVWSRLYFDLGQRVGSDCRTLALTAQASTGGAVTTSAILPLPIDVVTAFEAFGDNWVRVYTLTQAPFPVHVIAKGYEKFTTTSAAYFELLWVQGGSPLSASVPHVLKLTGVNTRPGPTINSFDVQDATLYAAVAATLSARTPAWLAASPVPDPASLAMLLSASLSWAMNAACVGSPPEFQVGIKYDCVADTFAPRVKTRHEDSWSSMQFSNELAAYMSFGRLNQVTRGVFGSAPQKRAVPSNTYAQLQTGDTVSQALLTDWTNTAFNLHIFPQFTYGYALTPAVPQTYVTVTVPAGVYDHAALALALSNVTVSVTYVTTPYPAFVFSKRGSADDITLDFTGTTVANRLGFDAVLYGFAMHIVSVFPVPHVPLLTSVCSGCEDTRPLTCGVRAKLQPGTASLSLQIQPLPPTACPVVVVDPTHTQLTLQALGPNLNFIRPGDAVNLLVPGVSASYIPGIVVSCVAATVLTTGVLTVQMFTNISAYSAGSVLLSPQPPDPLVVYMQRGPMLAPMPPNSDCGVRCQSIAPPNNWGNTLDPDTFGFQPWTYISCLGVLVSPGTLEVFQDTHILVVLTMGNGNTGNLYYPFPTPDVLDSLTVFAKVLRAGLFLQSGFERTFDHAFGGTGSSLTSMGVALYNPNGTPYQTHGHTVAITLKCEAKSNAIEWGGAHVVVPGHPSPDVEPFARGSILRNSWK